MLLFFLGFSVKETTPAPAYERYEHLAKKVPETLQLPSKYKKILEFFKGTETVVSLLQKRCETCTFAKLKSAVQELVKRYVLKRTQKKL